MKENNVSKEFPKNTVYLVVVLVSEEGMKKLMIASFFEDDNYDKNRAAFLMKAMLKCKLEHFYIEDIQSIRSKEELERLKSHGQSENNLEAEERNVRMGKKKIPDFAKSAIQAYDLMIERYEVVLQDLSGEIYDLELEA